MFGRRLRVAAAAWAVMSMVAWLAGGFMAPTVAGAGTTAALLRYPYLTDVGAGSALVNFATDTASPAPVVTFGPASTSCASTTVAAGGTPIVVNGRAETQFVASLSGLSPNTSYCYRVFQGGADLLGADPSPEFTTALAPGASGAYSFAVIGDWGAGTPAESSVLGQIAASPAQFVVTVGDNAYNNGTQTDYGDLLGGNVFAPQYWKGVGASRPIFAAQGNHGVSQTAAYVSNFPQAGVVASSNGRYQADTFCCTPPLAGSANATSAWYAFDWGQARFYVLDAAWADNNGGYAGDFAAHWNGPVPGCPACGTERQWLEQDLASHAGTPWKFAFFHYPLYSDNPSHPSDTALQGVNGLEGLLAKNHVSAVFNGHAHIYERNRPQIPGSPMVSYVTGGGGDTLGAVGCSAFDAYAIGSGRACNAPTPTSSAQAVHFLLVTVNGNTVTVTPTDSTGRTFDVQTYTTAALPGVTTIDSGPATPTNKTTATFTFHSTAPGPTFSCALDANAASPCTSPITYTAIPAGPHTFTVTTTAAIPPSPAPVSASWTVDTSPPTAPTGLTAVAGSDGRVTLAWNPSQDDNGVYAYVVFRDNVPLNYTAGTTTTLTDATTAPSTTYQYTVDARDRAGNISARSTGATVTTPAVTPPTTTPPTTTPPTTPPTTVPPVVSPPTQPVSGPAPTSGGAPSVLSADVSSSDNAPAVPAAGTALPDSNPATAQPGDGASAGVSADQATAPTTSTPPTTQSSLCAPGRSANAACLGKQAIRPGVGLSGSRRGGGWSMYWLLCVAGIGGGLLITPVLLATTRRRRNVPTEVAPSGLLIDLRAARYLAADEQALACAYLREGSSDGNDTYVVLTDRNLWSFDFASTDSDVYAPVVRATALNPQHILKLDVDEAAGTTHLVHQGGEVTWHWSAESGARRLMRTLRDACDTTAGMRWLMER